MKGIITFNSEMEVEYSGPTTIARLRTKYDVTDKDITDVTFPQNVRAVQCVVLEVIRARQLISTLGAISEMEAHGLRPANVAELLSFGANSSASKLEGGVVALGQTWTNHHGVQLAAYVQSQRGVRFAGMIVADMVWTEEWCFAGVKRGEQPQSNPKLKSVA